MNKKLLLLIWMIVFSGSCTLAPEYQRPEAPVPDAWPTGAAYRNIENLPGAAAPMQIPWRQYFTDKHLQRVIETALNNNRDFKIAAFNVQRARAIYGIQRAELYPTVDAAAAGSKQRVPADLSAASAA